MQAVSLHNKRTFVTTIALANNVRLRRRSDTWAVLSLPYAPRPMGLHSSAVVAIVQSAIATLDSPITKCTTEMSAQSILIIENTLSIPETLVLSFFLVNIENVICNT